VYYASPLTRPPRLSARDGGQVTQKMGASGTPEGWKVMRKKSTIIQFKLLTSFSLIFIQDLGGIVLILETRKDRKYWIRLNTTIEHFKLPIDTWSIGKTTY
jgi:hypothetical protein